MRLSIRWRLTLWNLAVLAVALVLVFLGCGGALWVVTVQARKELARARAQLLADLAITDSAFMVLLWNFLMRDRIRRVSGLEYLYLLLQRAELREPHNTLWVMPSTEALERNLKERGLGLGHVFFARQYDRVEAVVKALLAQIFRTSAASDAVLQQAHHTHGGRGRDGTAGRLVVQADVAADDGHAQSCARFGQAFDRGEADTDTTAANDFFGNAINSGTNLAGGYYNLIRTQVGFGGAIVTTADPRLGPLALNGGPTPTCALLDGSPAIDADDSGADGPLFDQRGGFAALPFFAFGFLRVQDGNSDGTATVDIGAFEVQLRFLQVDTDDRLDGGFGLQVLREPRGEVARDPGDHHPLAHRG